MRRGAGLILHWCVCQKGLLDALKKENEVMDDIHLRVLDSRAICRDTTTDWKDQASGTIRELSRHYVKCNENELLQRFYLERKSASEDKLRYNYRCCRLSMKENWQRPDDMWLVKTGTGIVSELTTVGAEIVLLFVVRARDYIGTIGWYSVKVGGNSSQQFLRLWSPFTNFFQLCQNLHLTLLIKIP